MSLFNGINPIVGKDSSGNPISMVVNKGNASIVQAKNAQSIGASEATSDPRTSPGSTNPANPTSNKKWNTLSIKSMYASSGKVLSFGVGETIDKTTQQLVYTNTSGNWVAGLSPLTGSNLPRPNGITYANGKYVVATLDNTIVSDFKYNSNLPSPTGINQTKPKVTIAALGSVAGIDNLSNNGTIVVGGSMVKSGTWITSSDLPNNEWGHHVGEVELVLTRHKGTSYTFPGYTATAPQIQRPYAIPNGDKPPIDWTTGNDRTNGYYGVIGTPTSGPTFTISWIKSA